MDLKKESISVVSSLSSLTSTWAEKRTNPSRHFEHAIYHRKWCEYIDRAYRNLDDDDDDDDDDESDDGGGYDNEVDEISKEF